MRRSAVQGRGAGLIEENEPIFEPKNSSHADNQNAQLHPPPLPHPILPARRRTDWASSTKACLIMLKLLLSVVITAFSCLPTRANWCYPTSQFAERINYGEAIFVGVARDIVELTEHLPDAISVTRRVFYFSVIKAQKRSNIQSAFLTIAEHRTTCGNFLSGGGVGDTVLVYARYDKARGLDGGCDTPFSILSKPIEFEHGQVRFPGYLKEEVAFLSDSSEWYVPKGDPNPSPMFGTAKKLKTTNWNSEPEIAPTAPKKNAAGASWLYIVLIPSVLLNLLFLFHILKKAKK
jgi:hypothetical protein